MYVCMYVDSDHLNLCFAYRVCLIVVEFECMCECLAVCNHPD